MAESCGDGGGRGDPAGGADELAYGQAKVREWWRSAWPVVVALLTLYFIYGR